MPFGQLFVRSVSTSCIGIADAAVDAFNATASKRIGAGDGAKVALDPHVQHVAADAAVALDEVKLVLRRNIASLRDYAERGELAPVPLRVRYRYESSLAADRCTKLVSAMFNAAGGRAIFAGHPLQRAWLDINAARALREGSDRPLFSCEGRIFTTAP